MTRQRSVAGAMALGFLVLLAACGASGQVTPVEGGVTVKVAPAEAETNPGGSVWYSAAVNAPLGITTTVNWSVVEPDGGSIDPLGLYLASGGQGTFTVRATSIGDPSVSGTGTVVVTPAPVVSVVVAPHARSVIQGGAVQFTATVSGTGAGQSTDVRWSLGGVGGGSIEASGLFHASGGTGTFAVTATSLADASASGAATVTVTAAPVISVSVSPDPGTVPAGGSLQFAATVSNTSAGQSTAVTWTAPDPGGGAVDAAGLYAAPATAGTYHVRATSVADPSRSRLATVVVTPAGGLTQAQKVALVATRRWIFYHMSTGCNFTGGAWSGVPTNELVHDMVFSGSSPCGLYRTVRDAGGGLRVVHPPYQSNLNAVPDDAPDSSATGAGAGRFTAGTFWHAHVIGANESVGNKLAEFDRHLRAYLGAPGSAQALARVSLASPINAGVKFCWVDDWTADIVTRLFATYQSTVAALEADYPGLHVIHFAAPLQPADATRNGYRMAWSERLRTTYPGLVFDVDLVESTRQDGTTYTVGGQRALAPEWSADAPNGHLSEAGTNWVGSKLLDYLAAVAQR
ncbi:MAG: Ig-like domain-containing protein [Anaeromyxobacter sp.]|nr:Ig-like domain-containing protein [Anaeromyxobacter sp.]MBL0275908.1 Ig-like domain-containing protein [Anaeromyxobacter sp.]